jgi:hypothetical protein
MANIKISQLPAKGANLEATDLVEISEFNGSGYVSKSITGQEIIDAASGGSGVTDVTATAPISSSGGSTPDISIPQASTIDDGYLSSIDFSTFNAKQDELISGTNIKSLNGTSLLGSGGLSVQPTLVSGTNIKTINGSSVLGSGDLTITGGGGFKGLHNVIGYFDLTSQGISAQLNASGTSPVGMGANQMYAYPFIPNNTITSVSLKINVTTLGAGVNCRILIYSSVSGVPTTKVYESANLDCSTVGVKTATTSFTFTAGTTYWLCLQSSGVTSLSGIQTSALIPLAMATSPASTPTVAYINTSTFGSAPTTFAINNRTNSAVPLVGIYLS